MNYVGSLFFFTVMLAVVIVHLLLNSFMEVSQIFVTLNQPTQQGKYQLINGVLHILKLIMPSLQKNFIWYKNDF